MKELPFPIGFVQVKKKILMKTFFESEKGRNSKQVSEETACPR